MVLRKLKKKKLFKTVFEYKNISKTNKFRL